MNFLRVLWDWNNIRFFGGVNYPFKDISIHTNDNNILFCLCELH